MNTCMACMCEFPSQWYVVENVIWALEHLLRILPVTFRHIPGTAETRDGKEWRSWSHILSAGAETPEIKTQVTFLEDVMQARPLTQLTEHSGDLGERAALGAAYCKFVQHSKQCSSEQKWNPRHSVGQEIIITVKSEIKIASCYSRRSPCAKSDCVSQVSLAHSHIYLLSCCS